MSDADFVDVLKPNGSPFKQACDPESSEVTMQMHGGTQPDEHDEREHLLTIYLFVFHEHVELL